MPGHLAVVAHNAVVTHATIMGNMAVRHNKTVIAHGGLPAVTGAFMNGNKFSYSGVIADLNIRLLTFEFKILWCGTYYSARENAAISAYSNAFHYSNIAAYPGTGAYFNILVNNGKGVNFYIFSKPGIWMYVRMRMDHSLSAYLSSSYLIFETEQS
jgi:hypothetical protein